MGLFRRKSADDVDLDEVDLDEDLDDQLDVDGDPDGAGGGPHDVADLDEPRSGRLDMGALLLPLVDGMQVRIDVDADGITIVAVTVLLGESALELRSFAAPRSSGVWDEVRTELRGAISGQGGTVDEVEGPFGTELQARLPAQLPDGSRSLQSLRFLGVDGRRWFLRGVLSGRAADDRAAAGPLEAFFADVVVVRGDAPMAPRDPIPLRAPDTTGGPGADGDTGGEADGDTDGGERDPDSLSPFERGPEITEIR